VAVDHRLGKNLIGSFYQPGLVLADVQTLTTLPRRELISGWPETVKHGLILESDFFGLLDANVEHLLKLTPEVTTKVVAQSANIKDGVVAEDERETGKRIILNYGHTIAHGLEAATGYSRFLHGEAVAIGMVGAAKLSQRLGLLPQEKVQRIEVLLQKFGLPTDCSGVDLDNVLEAMTLDKKVRGKAIRWILLEDIGRVVIQSDVPQKETLEALRGVIKP
jgi:3-dehydroquinate synthase